MTTIVFLKFFHYVSIFLAGGLGVANALLFKNHQKATMAPAPPVQKTMNTLARLGLVSIVILWLTGLPMTILLYGSFDLGWPFHLKMFGATTLVGGSCFFEHTSHQTGKNWQSSKSHSDEGRASNCSNVTGVSFDWDSRINNLCLRGIIQDIGYSGPVSQSNIALLYSKFIANYIRVSIKMMACI